MAKFTVILKDLIDSGYNLGLNQYPIFNEEYRGSLNAKIINHFYMREIGFETAGLFVNRLNTKMSEIMPYYNQLYNSALLKIDPFQTYRFEQTKTETEKTDNSTGFTTSTKNVSSDTPQGLLSIGDIEDEIYASSASIGNDKSNTEYDGTRNRLESISASGSLAGTSFSKLLKEYRDTFLNIDMQVIAELEELFMMIWDY